MDFRARRRRSIRRSRIRGTARGRSGPITLYTLLGNYPSTAALKDGRVSSPLVEFDFADVKVLNTRFKPLVREHRVRLRRARHRHLLQADEFGMPYVLLPATVVGRGQHHTIFYNASAAR